MFWKKKRMEQNQGPAKPVLRCSFCNKSQRDVKKLIAGPKVYICCECVDICRDILTEDRVIDSGKSQAELEREKALLERGAAVRCGLCDNMSELKLMMQVRERGWVCQKCVEAIRDAGPLPIQ